MLKKLTLFSVLSFMLLLMVYPTAAQDPSNPRLEWEDIENVSIPFDSFSGDTIQLNSGYANVRVDSQFLAPTIFLLADVRAFGDLDGDGLEDVVGVILADLPGPFEISYLMVVLNDNGEPNVMPLLRLGDREPVNSISIIEREIGIRILTHGEGDNGCCPTQETVQRFLFTGSELLLTEENALFRQVNDQRVPRRTVDFGLIAGTEFEPQELHFPRGTSTLEASGRIAHGEVEYFQFFAREGQYLNAQLSSPHHNVTMSLSDRVSLNNLFEGNNQFDPTGISGFVPVTRLYVIRVQAATFTDADFTLTIHLDFPSP